MQNPANNANRAQTQDVAQLQNVTQSQIIIKPNPNALSLNQIVADDSTPWQVYNCKIVDKTVTQDAPLPFLYHYDALPDDIKAAHPLTADLLKQFQTLMSAKAVASLLNIDEGFINVPWQVKVTGTLVMFCERLQIALRLKFTNTAKTLDPIYSKTAEEALKIAMSDWHFYGDVFVLNKGATPLVVIDSDDNWASVVQSGEYQGLRTVYALPILAELETVKERLTVLDEAIQLRLV